MGKGAFVQIKKYGGSGGGSHLAHDLRKKTRKELRGDIEKFGDWDSVMRHIREIKPIRKSQKWDYMEIVAYPENSKQAEAILDYLQQLLHRPVAGVWHFDERTPHVHYVIAWRDEEGRALRLQKGMLHTIKRDIARAVGREITPRGQGRRTVPMHVYMSDPEYFDARAKLESSEIKKAREGIKQVLKHYGKIQIFFLKRGVGTINYPKGIVGMVNNVISVIPENGKPYPLNIQKLYNNNAYGRDEVVFRPMQYYYGFRRKEKNLLAVKVFIDDIPKNMIRKLPHHSEGMRFKFSDTILVETSPGKYQAHFTAYIEYLPSVEVDKEGFARFVFRFFSYYYQGDMGSCDPLHLRKLPGFRNTKYNEEPVVMWKRIETPEFNPDEIEKSLEEFREIVNKRQDIPTRKITKREQAQKQWIDFYADMKENGAVDLSRVDMKYAVYLASRGYSEDEIKDALKAESADIAMRKRGHLDDYLTRTVKKAVEFALSPEIKKEEPKPHKGKEAQIGR